MKLSRPDADVFVPDGAPMPEALRRATHVCVGAHQDDQEFMALHGIIECFGRKGRGFAGVVVTNGAGSARTDIYSDYTNEDMVRVRVKEQRKAAVVGEYACQIQLMHPSGDVKKKGHPGVVADLRAVFEIARPEVLYLHNPADKHDTHVSSCLRTIEAIRSLPKDRRPKKVLGCEIWRDLDWLNDGDKVVLPVERFKNLAAALSGVYDSQITGGKRYDVAAAGRRTAHATFYESHATDKTDALSFAMDLTPVVEDEKLDVLDYTLGFLRRFEGEVRDRFSRLA
ncbi:MAG TPA: PIG-L family deacetylase [Vicinamibacteria bacterium]|nr:PIG-L family deacetylase [Vicinamibacteria bacterium]